MYQCMAYNDLDTRYSSGQLRVLGDRENKEKWRPTFTKHPLEEKMFAAEGGNISIKYASYPLLALTPNFTCHWFWLFRRDLCHRKCELYYTSNSKTFLKSTSPTPKLVQQNYLFRFYNNCDALNNSSEYFNYPQNDTTQPYMSAYLQQVTKYLFEMLNAISNKDLFSVSDVENGWDFYNFFFPKIPLHCMFAFDTSLLFQPLVINFLFSKGAIKLFAKVFLKNYFSKKVYKKYFKYFFKMVFRNLPKACIKLVFKYSFKVILNVLAKIYFFFFLIYLFSYGKRRKVIKN